MSEQLKTIKADEAQGPAAELFGAIKRGLGKVPAAYLTIGANSPATLELALRGGEALRSGSLSAKEIEAINLAVSEASGCAYCVAAHTLAAKAAGLSEEQTLELRRGQLEADPKIGALAAFARKIAWTPGEGAARAELARAKEAGYSDRQIVEAIRCCCEILFTNMLNRANETELDFPAAPALRA